MAQPAGNGPFSRFSLHCLLPHLFDIPLMGNGDKRSNGNGNAHNINELDHEIRTIEKKERAMWYKKGEIKNKKIYAGKFE